jgi:hypothetical protein
MNGEDKLTGTGSNGEVTMCNVGQNTGTVGFASF